MLSTFVAARDWERFHAPKNLAMAIACEAAELMEHYLWIDAEASRAVTDDAAEREGGESDRTVGRNEQVAPRQAEGR